VRWLRLALRGLAFGVTAGSIAFMLAPDRFAAPMRALGLGGQFALGTVVVLALAAEVFAWGSQAASGDQPPRG
jgi:hypothetical protein